MSLRGLKENVIVGRLIPAGTGFAHHKERIRKRREKDIQEVAESSVSAIEAEKALVDALNASMAGDD